MVALFGGFGVTQQRGNQHRIRRTTGACHNVGRRTVDLPWLSALDADAGGPLTSSAGVCALAYRSILGISEIPMMRWHSYG